ncbi:uncharacterized protein LOC142991138 [Genypterus blacodes]|uniref:uncharacterized protein LOC142991138 n=1 Tax=Genypterus blacodes TaxID=154954 RepID=UPI003F765561
MKTLCVAIVAFSLITVCQMAPMNTCEQLMKPVDKGPDISGTWYLTAVASDSCLLKVGLAQLLMSSLAFEISATDKPNSYMANMTLRLFGYCYNDNAKEAVFYNGTVISADGEDSDSLLSTGCRDCMVIREHVTDVVSIITLMSRRKNITAAELEEFDKQAECFGMSKPQTIGTDNDETCKPSTDETSIVADLFDIIGYLVERYSEIISTYTKCILRTGCPKQLQ